MKGYHPPGRPLGASPLEAIRLVGKTGFLCRETWCLFFATGNPRWKRRQLHYLIEHNFLKPHRNSEARGIFVLGSKGFEFLSKEGMQPVSPPLLSNVAHDRVIMESLFRLSQDEIVRHWQTEAELKKSNPLDLQLKVKNNKNKFPDATALINIAEKQRLIAFEYERERKSFSRYREIMYSYANLLRFSMVLYVCETNAIRKAIQNTMIQLGSANLSSRVGFVEAHTWKENPSTAAITIRGKIIRLADVGQKNPEKFVA